MSDEAGTGRPVSLRAGWFELFYDLVIVAAVTHGAHLLTGRQDVPIGAWLIGTFFVTFVLWFSTSLAINIAPGEVPGRKALMFVQMMAMTVANLSVGRSEGLSDRWGMAALAVAVASIAVIYALIARRMPSVRSEARVWAWSMGSSGAVLALGAAAPDDAGSVRGIALAVACVLACLAPAAIAVPRLLRDRRIAEDHLRERLGQFVIIVLGESFLGLVIVLDGLESIPEPAFFALALLVAGALWVVYFTSVHPQGLPTSAGRFELWLLGFIVFGIGAAYSASLHAAFSANSASWVSGEHPFAFLPAAYALVGALILCLAGGRYRVIAYATVHATCLAVLVTAWLALLIADERSGQVLLILGSACVIADALACLALRRRLDRTSPSRA